MNRKNEKLASYLVGAVAGLLFMGLLLLLGGCAADKVSAAEPGTGNRFTTDDMSINLFGEAWVITDNETGVQYLCVETGNGCGLTVLQPGDTTMEE